MILAQKTRHPVGGSLFASDISKHRRKVKPHNPLPRQGSVHVQGAHTLFGGVLNLREFGKEQNHHHHQCGKGENPVDGGPRQLYWRQPSHHAQNDILIGRRILEV